MEIITKKEMEQPLVCPYLNIECRPACPGWIEVADDCLFHVCLTEVRETFVAAARFLDERLGLADGMGMQTLQSLRQVIKGNASLEEQEIVRSVLGSFIQTGVLSYVAKMSINQMADFVSGAEKKISFAINYPG